MGPCRVGQENPDCPPPGLDPGPLDVGWFFLLTHKLAGCWESLYAGAHALGARTSYGVEIH